MTEGKDGIPEPWGTVARLIRDVGFPIFVALYLLMRVDPMLTELRIAMMQLAETQRQLVIEIRDARIERRP